MVKSLSATLVVVSVVFIVTDAFRSKMQITNHEPQELTKCVAEGSNGAEGMMISWGSAAAMRECGPTRHIEGEGMTYEWQFSNAFSVSFDKRCVCNIEGKTIATFKAINRDQAKLCAGTATEENPVLGIKSQCWEAYKRGRGTRFNEMKVPLYKVPWMPGHFVVSKPGKCIGEACNSITLPGVLDGMSREDKRIIGAAIKKIIDGQKNEVPGLILKMIEVLPPDALDDAEFAQIDEDGDATLTLDELSNFYTTFDRAVIDRFIREVDDNGNGSVDRDEFSQLKQKMRDYNPAVDIIDGEVDFLLSPSDIDALPKWMVSAVVCMKGGTAVPEEECKGEGPDAILAFNQGEALPKWKVTEVRCMKGRMPVDEEECEDPREDAIDSFNSHC